MLLGRSLEKDIRPSIDEKGDFGCVGGLPSSSDAIALINCLAQSSIRWEAVFKITADCSRDNHRVDGLAHHLWPVTITAFHTDPYAQRRRADVPPNAVNRPSRRT